MRASAAFLALLVLGCKVDPDQDGDGYAAAADCDDGNADVHPGATESCNKIDDDCDGYVDEGADGGNTWYLDADGDRFGDPALSTTSCMPVEGYVADATDCDDDDPQINPNGVETCNELDDDCDDEVDEPDEVESYVLYRDADGDGYGDEDDFIETCVPVTGYVEEGGDCDDDDDAVNPDATDTFYDGIDSDCDGASDFDQDGDGFDSHLESGGYDCDDSDATAWACGTSQELAALDCDALHTARSTLPDGVFWIDPDGDGDTTDAWQAYCDMERDGGGWTLVMQNNQGVTSTDNPTWDEATSSEILLRGGSLSENPTQFDLWVGLAAWSELGTEARIEVGDSWGDPDHQATYTLKLDASDGWKLTLSNEKVTVGGTSPGFYSYHNNRRLTTVDADNDEFYDNCASTHGHPWWYKICASGSLWGSETYTPDSAAYWTGTSTAFEWGALWLR